MPWRNLKGFFIFPDRLDFLMGFCKLNSVNLTRRAN